jgi:acyl carrier protein
VICSGEPLSLELQERFFAASGAELHNLYGPTEAAVDVTAWKCERDGDRRSVPIGLPIANTRIYILDAKQEVVPVGVSGELYIGGAGLSRGYLGSAGLTAERFVPDRYGREGGQRLYRTGDVARYGEEGVIEFLGRVDDQVKVRGFRIELGEIEAVLCAHERVREAAVVAREGPGGGKSLVAYVVLKEFAGVEKETSGVAGAVEGSAHELRAHVRARLPEHMVPAAVVLLAEMPLTPSGKLDRRALPEVERWGEGESVGGRRQQRALTPVEEVLAGIWREVLGAQEVGAEESFFDVGGHSLLATQVVSRVREVFGIEVSLREMFERPTVAAMAKAVEEAQGEGGGERAQTIKRVKRDLYRVKSSGQERLAVPENVRKLL